MIRALSLIPLMILGLAGLAACGSQEQAGEEDVMEGEGETMSTQTEEVDPNADAYVFLCGDTQVAARFLDPEQMRMTVNGREYALFRVVSGSGARFQGGDGQNTEFWTQGDTAMLTLDGEEYPQCTLESEPAIMDTAAADTSAAPSLTGSQWVVEDINDGGVIDSSRVTLTFGEDGRLAGMASCNNYNTTYAAGDGAMTLSPAAVTRKMCPEALMAQETAFLNALEGVSSYQFREDGALELSGSEVSIIARR